MLQRLVLRLGPGPQSVIQERGGWVGGQARWVGGVQLGQHARLKVSNGQQHLGQGHHLVSMLSEEGSVRTRTRHAASVRCYNQLDPRLGPEAARVSLIPICRSGREVVHTFFDKRVTMNSTLQS